MMKRQLIILLLTQYKSSLDKAIWDVNRKLEDFVETLPDDYCLDKAIYTSLITQQEQGHYEILEDLIELSDELEDAIKLFKKGT